MKKYEFLDELCRALRFCPSAEEAQRTVNFYSEAIDDRMEDGMSEEEAVAAMGSVEDIVRELKTTWQREDSAPAGETVRPGTVRRDFSPLTVRRIEVLDTSGHISILPSPDGDIHIEYTATELWRYDITGESDLSVRRVKNGRWGKSLTLGLFGREFTLPIPNFNGAFTSGLALRLLLPAGAAPAVSVNSASGDVECRNVSPARLNVKLASGGVTLAYARMEGPLSVITISGDVDLTEVSAPEISVSTVSGDIDIEDLNAAELDLKTVSGDTDAGHVAVTQRLTAGTVSGDLELHLTVPCERAGVDSVSGDVDLSLAGSDTLYTMTTKTNTGNVEISGHRYAGPNQVRVKTMSGDISVSFNG